MGSGTKGECSSFKVDLKATMIMIVKNTYGFCTKIWTNKQLFYESLEKKEECVDHCIPLFSRLCELKFLFPIMFLLL